MSVSSRPGRLWWLDPATEMPTLAQASAVLCLCTSPHFQDADQCMGPAPVGTPLDTVFAAAVSRALASRADPTGFEVDAEGRRFTVGDAVGYVLDPHDFTFYLATLTRGLERFASGIDNQEQH